MLPAFTKTKTGIDFVMFLQCMQQLLISKTNLSHAARVCVKSPILTNQSNPRCMFAWPYMALKYSTNFFEFVLMNLIISNYRITTLPKFQSNSELYFSPSLKEFHLCSKFAMATTNCWATRCCIQKRWDARTMKKAMDASKLYCIGCFWMSHDKIFAQSARFVLSKMKKHWYWNLFERGSIFRKVESSTYFPILMQVWLTRSCASVDSAACNAILLLLRGMSILIK